MGDKDVLVIGYPRSGNTYMARLLGDALNSPVKGWDTAHPLAEEGFDRPGLYTVRQLHLRPNYAITSGGAIHNAWTFAPRCYQGEKIVFLIRDPRDVAISAMYYWDIPGVKETVHHMAKGSGPLDGVGSWTAFYSRWSDYLHDKRLSKIYTILAYEDLVMHPIFELQAILRRLDLPCSDLLNLEEVTKRQSIEARRKEIKGSGNKYMYGETIQLKHLRKGCAGDWKAHFTPALNRLALEYFGPTMLLYGYPVDLIGGTMV